MKRLVFKVVVFVGFIGLAVSAYAQQPGAGLRFEVASVKPCVEKPALNPGERRGDGLESSPDRLHLPCQTLMSLVQWAYVVFADGRLNPLARVAVSGGPAWINSEQFQIDAKGDGAQANGAQANGTMNGPMLRALLEERFHLKVRHDVKEVPVYALTLAKSGVIKAPRAAGNNCVKFDPEHPMAAIEPGKPFPAVSGMARVTNKGYEAMGVTMQRFADLLSDNADRKVVDRTGLLGEFDIHLDLSATDLGHGPGAGDPTEVFATVRAEVQRLGLRLQPGKGPGEQLVVERAERPASN